MAVRNLGRSIIECGRGNHGAYERRLRARGYRRWKLVDGEYEPGPQRGDRVELRDNLTPLSRWLKAQVGRPWNAVYSEFSAASDRRTTRGDHIHTHLLQMVGGAGGRQYMGYASPWLPLCMNLGLHGGWDFFVNEDGLLEHHTRVQCWAWSAARGYFPPKADWRVPGARLPAWADMKRKPEPYVKPRDPVEVLKERKLERNRLRNALPES